MTEAVSTGQTPRGSPPVLGVPESFYEVPSMTQPERISTGHKRGRSKPHPIARHDQSLHSLMRPRGDRSATASRSCCTRSAEPPLDYHHLSVDGAAVLYGGPVLPPPTGLYSVAIESLDL
jgi:hypothetical protein